MDDPTSPPMPPDANVPSSDVTQPAPPPTQVSPPPMVAAVPPSGVGAQKKSRKWLWGCGGCGCLALILGVVLVVSLSGGALFGGLFGMVFDARQPAVGFLDAMKSGNYSAAYDYLSAARKSEVDKETFLKALEGEDIPAKNISSYSLNNVDVKNDRATVKGSVTLKDGSNRAVTIFLVKESGKWKIERLEGLD